MSDAKFDGADMSEVVMSKAYAVGASFKGKVNAELKMLYSPSLSIFPVSDST